MCLFNTYCSIFQLLLYITKILIAKAKAATLNRSEDFKKDLPNPPTLHTHADPGYSIFVRIKSEFLFQLLLLCM